MKILKHHVFYFFKQDMTFFFIFEKLGCMLLKKIIFFVFLVLNIQKQTRKKTNTHRSVLLINPHTHTITNIYTTL
jgi:hypothetical protein